MTSMTGTRRTVILLALGVCCSTGLAWASVPLYRLFCQATGLNGTTGRGLRAPGAVDGKITIAFDTNVSPQLKWKFKPEAESETIDIGARDMAFFTATNTSNKTVTGTATFNVMPAQAGKTEAGGGRREHADTRSRTLPPVPCVKKKRRTPTALLFA